MILVDFYIYTVKSASQKCKVISQQEQVPVLHFHIQVIKLEYNSQQKGMILSLIIVNKYVAHW